MAVSSVLNAASYQQSAKQIGTDSDAVAVGQTSIAPGEIVSIFDQKTGPQHAVARHARRSSCDSDFQCFIGGTLNTSGLTLQFTVTGTFVTVNFAVNEDLAHVVSDINGATQTLGLGGSVASIRTLAGSSYVGAHFPDVGRRRQYR